MEAHQRWIILRTSAGRTLALASSLLAAGLDAWTPIETLERRRPRSSKVISIEAPIIPTFVFVRERWLSDLISLLAQPAHQHPAFSLFKYAGRVPIINDREVDRLRIEEMRRRGETRRKDRANPRLGAEYRPTEGPYAGLSGVIEGTEGGNAIVSFGGWMNHVEIDAWLVPQVEVQARAA